MRFILSFLALSVVAFSADVIPTARRFAWERGVTVGVPGGIPTDRNVLFNVVTYGADPTGVANSAPFVGNTVDACDAYNQSHGGSGGVVYFPAGTYRFNSGISVFSGMTWRGETDANGAPLATIKYYGSTGSACPIAPPDVADPSWYWPNTPITGSPSKGATTLTVSDTSNITDRVGKMLQISLVNDTSLPVVSVNGYQRLRGQMVKLVAINSPTSIEIFPALAFDLPESLSPTFVLSEQSPSTPARSQVDFAGLEDLIFDGENSTSPLALIIMEACYGSWIKNVEVRKSANREISISHSLNCEVRHSYIHDRNGVGPNGAGILMGRTSGFLLEDNIFNNQFPAIETNDACSANVYAYNYVHRSNDQGAMGASFDTNHGPHQSFQLIEGNIMPVYQSDGYFGGESEATIFRNWLHGTTDQAGVTTGFWACRVQRFSRNFNIVGNLIGRADYGYSWSYTNIGAGFDTSSSTSNAISGTGGYSFTVQTGLSQGTGGTYLAQSSGTPSAWITGMVNSYDSSTGALSINAYRVNGSGTHSDWIIVGGQGYGTPICLAIGGPNIGNGGVGGGIYRTVSSTSLGVNYWVWNGNPMVRPAGFDANMNQPNTAYTSTPSSVSGITRSGTTATVTTASPHGYYTGYSATISGASQSAYNGVFPITVTGSSTFTYTVAGSPATPATGTITTLIAFTTNNAVEFTADGATQYTGGNAATVWLANNPAKNNTSTWDTPGPSSSDWLPISANSFQDLDYDAYSTGIIKGNWNAATESIPSNESLGSSTYPDSYYLGAKPSFFGSLAWPPVDAANPPADQSSNNTFANMLPAAWRFIYGNENYLDTVSAPQFSPTAGSYVGAQSISMSTATSGADIYYTTNGTTPDAGSTHYTSPVSVTTTTTLKAIGIKSGLSDSSVTTGTYTIGPATGNMTVSGSTTVTGSLRVP